jgi:signal transduction histidine kinase
MMTQMFGPLPSKYVDYSRDIHASGRHLLSVIDDILDISRIEAGRFELDQTEFDLGVEFRTCLDIVKAQLDERKQTLAMTIEDGALRLTADRRAIRQVVINLLANAIKASPRAGAIDLMAHREADDFVVLSIADRGHGMSAEETEHAFDPMWQAEASLSRGRDGTGLGLTICKRLVDLHGGTIGISSEPDRGTTVSVRLPIAGNRAGGDPRPPESNPAEVRLSA